MHELLCVDQERRLEVADVFRKLISKTSNLKLSADKYRVFQAIVSCRTARLGGHVNRCDNCGYEEQSYNSCWNRHCPKCQGGEAFLWTDARSKELLPVPYFHLVFTLPKEFRELCHANKRIFYNLLYAASSETLIQVSQNNLDITPGFFGVLHTWNQELLYHPHLHYVIPGGGVDTSGKWKSFSQNGKFFLPVRVLSKIFRGKFIQFLKQSYAKLYLEGKLSYLKNPYDFEHLISKAAIHNWVVYAKRPFAGPEIVLKYLSNYTHRVGVANSRLRNLSDQTVTFSARHKIRKGKKRLVTLSHQSFIQRFLLHVLPKGFRRIRYFGYLNSPTKNSTLAKIRAQLTPSTQNHLTATPPLSCTHCNRGTLKLFKLYNPHRKLKRQWLPSRHAIQMPKFFCLSPPNRLGC